MRNIEFVSYDGEYPCLCCGTLVVDIDGERYEFVDILISGGSASVDLETFEETVTYGNWEITYTDKGDRMILMDKNFNNISLSREELNRLTELVNYNVEEGCCGGCI